MISFILKSQLSIGQTARMILLRSLLKWNSVLIKMWDAAGFLFFFFAWETNILQHFLLTSLNYMHISILVFKLISTFSTISLPYGYMLHIFDSRFFIIGGFKDFIWCGLSERFYSLFKLISRICSGYTLHIFGSLLTMFWRFTDSIWIEISFSHAIAM